jgi:hypothetical protein
MPHPNSAFNFMPLRGSVNNPMKRWLVTGIDCGLVHSACDGEPVATYGTRSFPPETKQALTPSNSSLRVLQ